VKFVIPLNESDGGEYMAGQASYDLVLHKDADPRTGGVAICGFSTVGMVGVIAASHVISQLDLTQQGTVLNSEFPAMALVHHEVPKHPVRVYQGSNVGVFTAEVRFGPERDVLFANTVLEWFTKGGFDQLIVIDGVARENLDDRDGSLYGVSASKPGRARLKNAGIEPVRQGVVAGIAGYLIAEGDRLGLDITAILADCNPMFPDARAAAMAIEAVSELTEIDIPLSSLLEDARKIEDSVREVFENSQTMLPAPDDEIDPSFS
jgi:uncharacterized protein